TDGDTRSRAEWGLANALKLQAADKPPAESTALLKAALDHFLNVFFCDNLGEFEEPDPIWIQTAGLAAARVAEDLKQWNVAINVYQRLQTSLPFLGPRLQPRIDRNQEQLRLDNDRRNSNSP